MSYFCLTLKNNYGVSYIGEYNRVNKKKQLNLAIFLKFLIKVKILSFLFILKFF